MSFLVVIFSLLVPLLVSLVFVPNVFRFLGQIVGSHLRRSSRTRRELLLARVETEKRKYDAQHGDEKRDGDDWEHVASTTTSSAVGKEKVDRNWSGIVGFFHPFWYVVRVVMRVVSIADAHSTAMQAVVASVSSGQPFEQRRNDGQERFVLSTQATTM